MIIVIKTQNVMRLFNRIFLIKLKKNGMVRKVNKFYITIALLCYKIKSEYFMN